MKKTGKMLIYQVLVRLFGNDNSANKQNGTIEDNGCGKLSDFSEKALSEIKQMGYSHIWYIGLIEHATKTDYSAFQIRKDHPAVVKGNAGSPYAIKDYYDIDPDLADKVENRMEEFESLVDRTHQAGLKLIMDFVPNHVARQYFSDAKPKNTVDIGADDNIHTTYDVNNNFYYIPGQAFSPGFSLVADGVKYVEYPAKATGNDRFDASPGLEDWYETVKLNYGIDFLNGGVHHFNPAPDTWLKMLDILLFWCSKKVDAFRCDMAEMVPVEFWGWVIPQVKKQYPSVEFIAEIYNPDQYRNYIGNGGFDYLYDKVGLYDTLKAIVKGERGAGAITPCWQSVDDIQDKMLYFLENHDEQRIASDFFARNPEKAIPAMIAITTMNTNPVMVYFGQELGESGMDMEGFSGKDGKTTIFDYWSIQSVRDWRNKGKFDGKLLSKEQKDLRNFYAGLLTLCNKEKAIYKGVFYDLMYVNYHNYHFDADKQYAYLRQSANEVLLIVLNFSDSDQDSQVFLPGHAFEYMGVDPSKIGEGKDLLTGDKAFPSLKAESLYPVKLSAYSGKIIKFTVKK